MHLENVRKTVCSVYETQLIERFDNRHHKKMIDKKQSAQKNGHRRDVGAAKRTIFIGSVPQQRDCFLQSIFLQSYYSESCATVFGPINRGPEIIGAAAGSWVAIQPFVAGFSAEAIFVC